MKLHPPLPGPAQPRPTPETRPSRACVCGVELALSTQGWAGKGKFQENWKGRSDLWSPGHCISRSPLPREPALLTLSLVQEAREPTFANIPLNGSTGMVRGHASRTVMSAPGTRASGGVRTQPSRAGGTLPHGQGAPEAGCRYSPRYITSTPAPAPTQIPAVALRAKSSSKISRVCWGHCGHFPVGPTTAGLELRPQYHPDSANPGLCLNLSGSSSVKWGQEDYPQGCCRDQVS